MKRLIYVALVLFSYSASADQPDNAAPRIKPGDYQYKLIMSKDEKVCKYMRDILNKDLKTYGSGYHQDKFKDGVFTAILWKLYGASEEPGAGYDYGAEYAYFDINNDGKEELVVRWRSTVSNIDFHNLHIFDKTVSVTSLKKVKDIEDKNIGEISVHPSYSFKYLPPLPHKDWMEKGKQYYPSLSFYTIVYPFFLEKKNYLLIKESPDIRVDPELILIAKYIKGFVKSAQADQMEDVCYMKRKVSNAVNKRY